MARLEIDGINRFSEAMLTPQGTVLLVLAAGLFAFIFRLRFIRSKTRLPIR